MAKSRRRVLGVIPARFGSTRLPGKPLAPILGRPMVEWVYKSARKALPRVIVATDDARIMSVVKGFGGECMMTPKTCATGTDRVAWVARKIPAEFYVNVQGDEPLMNFRTIQAAVSLAVKKNSVATAAMEFSEDAAAFPNVVKVVVDKDGCALYFSRARIPFKAHGVEGKRPVLKHLGLYVYPRRTLFEFVRLKSPMMEKTEKLEQLRALFNGIPIFVAETPFDSVGVDTSADLRFVEKRLRASGVKLP